MNDIELKNKATAWLMEKSIEYKTRPQKFTASEVADAVGGRFNRIGHVVDDILLELHARKISINYRKINNRIYFEII